jgi:hypothetical protein
MEALRSVIKPKNNKIQLTLPNSFKESLVEVIVLPYLENNTNIISTNKIDSEAKKAQIHKLLLESPTMTDEDYKNFLEKREHFNKWKTFV